MESWLFDRDPYVIVKETIPPYKWLGIPSPYMITTSYQPQMLNTYSLYTLYQIHWYTQPNPQLYTLYLIQLYTQASPQTNICVTPRKINMEPENDGF